MKIIPLFLTIVPLLLTGCVGLNNSDPNGLQADQNRDVATANTARAFLNDNIKIGMSESAVSGLIGQPNENNVTRTATGKSEQWVYSGQQIILNTQGHDSWVHYNVDLGVLLNDFRVYLNFENGILTSTQGF
jgi:hypothetical protein